MKALSTLSIILLLAFILSGCSTPSPFVGMWVAESNLSGRVDLITIEKGGSVSLSTSKKSPAEELKQTGKWRVDSPEIISINIGGAESTGSLIDDVTLEMSAKGTNVTFRLIE